MLSVSCAAESGDLTRDVAIMEDLYWLEIEYSSMFSVVKGDLNQLTKNLVICYFKREQVRKENSFYFSQLSFNNRCFRVGARVCRVSFDGVGFLEFLQKFTL